MLEPKAITYLLLLIVISLTKGSFSSTSDNHEPEPQSKPVGKPTRVRPTNRPIPSETSDNYLIEFIQNKLSHSYEMTHCKTLTYNSFKLPVCAYYKSSQSNGELYTVDKSGGLTTYNDNGIGSDKFIQFDVRQICNKGTKPTNAQILVTSSQTVSSFQIYGSKKDRYLEATPKLSGTGSNWNAYITIFNFCQYDFISVASQAKDFLISGFRLDCFTRQLSLQPTNISISVPPPAAANLGSNIFIYVADTQNNRIQKFIEGVENGTTIAGSSSGSFGSESNLFNTPFTVCVDSVSNLYVSDTSNNRIQKWAPGATSGITVAGQSSGTSGSTNADLVSPYGVYVNSATGDDLYVADYGNFRVMKWKNGATQGSLVAGGNGLGSALNQFSQAVGVFVTTNSSIFVCDYGIHRVVKWLPGATEGIIVAGTGSKGSGLDQLNKPVGIFVDSFLNVFVADSGNNRIVKWRPNDIQGTIVAGNGIAGSENNQLNSPSGVFVDLVGAIYISDSNNHRIQKWLVGASEGITVAGGNGAFNRPNQINFPHGLWVAAGMSTTTTNKIDSIINTTFSRSNTIVEVVVAIALVTGLLVGILICCYYNGKIINTFHIIGDEFMIGCVYGDDKQLNNFSKVNNVTTV